MTKEEFIKQLNQWNFSASEKIKGTRRILEIRQSTSLLVPMFRTVAFVYLDKINEYNTGFPAFFDLLNQEEKLELTYLIERFAETPLRER